MDALADGIANADSKLYASELCPGSGRTNVKYALTDKPGGQGSAPHLAGFLSGDVSDDGLHTADSADGHQIYADDQAADW